MILQDTSLCAIVRDEMMNPAGGITRFVETVMPHVEQGVIVDTGSVDGTRQALEDLQKRFPNLRVVDYNQPFQSYAHARNFSLEQTRTPNVLVLDADEVIADQHKSVEGGFRILADELREIDETRKTKIGSQVMGINFPFIDVSQTYFSGSLGHNPRLFRRDDNKFKFVNKHKWAGEHLIFFEEGNPLSGSRVEHLSSLTLDSQAVIYHFIPEEANRLIKIVTWNVHPERWLNAPSTMPDFKEWKAYNPRRDEFK